MEMASFRSKNNADYSSSGSTKSGIESRERNGNIIEKYKGENIKPTKQERAAQLKSL